MKITFEKTPPQVEHSLKEGFKCQLGRHSFFSSQAPLPGRLHSLPVKQIQPHRQFTIQYRDLESSNPLASVIEVGWRFFEWSEAGAIGARVMWVRDHESGFVYFNLGRFVIGSVIGFQVAELMASRNAYVFRILALPQIHVFAIWLHNEGGNSSDPDNVLMPINPAPGVGSLPPPIAPLEPLTPYPAERFFELIKPLLNDGGRDEGSTEGGSSGGMQA